MAWALATREASGTTRQALQQALPWHWGALPDRQAQMDRTHTLSRASCGTGAVARTALLMTTATLGGVRAAPTAWALVTTSALRICVAPARDVNTRRRSGSSAKPMRHQGLREGTSVISRLGYSPLRPLTHQRRSFQSHHMPPLPRPLQQGPAPPEPRCLARGLLPLEHLISCQATRKRSSKRQETDRVCSVPMDSLLGTTFRGSRGRLSQLARAASHHLLAGSCRRRC